MPPKIPFKPGSLLYKYKLNRYIGGGQFGDVWLATDTQVLTDKAIKILDSPMASIVDQLKEARIGNHLDHPNLVKIDYTDIVKHELNNKTNPYLIIAMDYYPKGSVVDNLNSHNFLPINEAIGYILNVLAGLDYLHDKSIYHGDIKPNNILIGDLGEGILTDYGISCFTQRLQPVRTDNFYCLHAAPETVLNSIFSVQTDIYQVGFTLFRLLNGNGTISAKLNSMGEIAFNDAIIKGDVISTRDFLPFIPSKLRSIILKAVNVDLKKRYHSALEMRRDLEQFHYPGYWTTDCQGSYIGFLKNNIFTFEVKQSGNRVYNFIAWRENITSKKKTRVTAFCFNQIPKKQIQNNQSKFMQSVVHGSIT